MILKQNGKISVIYGIYIACKKFKIRVLRNGQDGKFCPLFTVYVNYVIL